MAKLTYQGHGSLRFVSNGGMVLYLDPFAGQGYDLPADLILVTHDHHDHNRVDLVTQSRAARFSPSARRSPAGSTTALCGETSRSGRCPRRIRTTTPPAVSAF